MIANARQSKPRNPGLTRKNDENQLPKEVESLRLSLFVFPFSGRYGAPFHCAQRRLGALPRGRLHLHSAKQADKDVLLHRASLGTLL